MNATHLNVKILTPTILPQALMILKKKPLIHPEVFHVMVAFSIVGSFNLLLISLVKEISILFLKINFNYIDSIPLNMDKNHCDFFKRDFCE